MIFPTEDVNDCCPSCYNNYSTVHNSKVYHSISSHSLSGTLTRDCSSVALAQKSVGTEACSSLEFTKKPSRHILFCTALGVGHYTPVSNLIAGLTSDHANEDLKFTFFSPIRQWEVKSCQPPAANPANLRCVQVPLAGEDVHPITMNAMLTRREQLSADLDNALASSPADWPPVSVVVHDFFAVYAFEYTEKVLKCPRMLFNPSHTLSFEWMGDLEIQAKILQGHRTHDMPGFRRPFELQLYSHFMHLGPPEPLFLHYDIRKVPQNARALITSDLENVFEHQLKKLSEKLASGKGINSMFPNIPKFYVGPLCTYHGKLNTTKDAVTSWLDEQPDRSVVFIALGTLYPIPGEALNALMEALERTPYHFLWAYKSKGDSLTETTHLLQQFKERCQHRGRVVEWVDQRSVLDHPSLRVFVSHGGWNSFVEAITLAGVPMICVPLGSEQPVNAVLAKCCLGIGDVALAEDTEWEKEHQNEFSEEEIAEAVSKLGSVPMQSMAVLKEHRRIHLRFLTAAEWSELLTDVCERKYNEYYLRAKECQANSLKSILPEGSREETLKRLSNFFRTVQ